MSGIIGGAGSKSGVIGENSPVMVGIFSPSTHSTSSSTGYIDVQLDLHDNLCANYTSYLTQSGVTLTIVKNGLYAVDLRVLNNTTTDCQLDLALVVTGYDTLRFRTFAPPHNDKWTTSSISSTLKLVTGNTILAASQNGAPGSINHHGGPNYTAMHITYLGTGK
jgi:hypothetical protein